MQLMYSLRGLYKTLNVTPNQNKMLSDMTGIKRRLKAYALNATFLPSLSVRSWKSLMNQMNLELLEKYIQSNPLPY